jgi:prepilin-type N-terminal cleavage/methylation domain-containing protein
MISTRRAGLTLIELMVVIMIVGIMMGVAVPSLQKTRAQRMARNARDVFIWNANRARSRAIETGNTYLYVLDPSTNKAWIYKQNPSASSDTLLTINFQTEYEATTSTPTNSTIALCYNPRGYAFSCSANSPSSNIEVTFTHASYTAKARVKPMGQMDRTS